MEIIFEEETLYNDTYPEGKLNLKLEGWKDFFEKKEVKKEVKRISKKLKNVLPDINLIFEAFKITTHRNIDVGIIGQDPYSDRDSPVGLCFSIKPGNKINRSMLEIQKVLEDCEFKVNRKSGDLSQWKRTLLINSGLSVKEDEPGSHIHIWNTFFNLLLEFIKEDVVWLLMGAEAQKHSEKIKSKYKIKTTHPVSRNKMSVTVINKYFQESKCFSRINELLKIMNKEAIDFSIK